MNEDIKSYLSIPIGWGEKKKKLPYISRERESTGDAFCSAQ